MRPLRYSINVTLDGCCDHRLGVVDEDLHRHAAENIAQADALLFGRVTYEMMEAGWRRPAPAGPRPGRVEPFPRAHHPAKKEGRARQAPHQTWAPQPARGGLEPRPY